MLTFGDRCSLAAQNYLIEINIQCTNNIGKIYHSQTPVLLSGSRLDRLLDEQSVSALLCYRPFTNPPTSIGK